MLSKKLTVQKSFRIDATMEEDLELLSRKLNRPQNELVNAALNQLMIDNMGWFAEDYLLNLCKDFFEEKVSEIEIKLTGLRFHIKYENGFYKFDYDIDNQSFEEHCKNGILVGGQSGKEVMINNLKEVALKIGIDSPEMQEYLHHRFGYIYSRQETYVQFDRDKFIRQSVGEEPIDESYMAVTEVQFSEEAQEDIKNFLERRK